MKSALSPGAGHVCSHPRPGTGQLVGYTGEQDLGSLPPQRLQGCPCSVCLGLTGSWSLGQVCPRRVLGPPFLVGQGPESSLWKPPRSGRVRRVSDHPLSLGSGWWLPGTHLYVCVGYAVPHSLTMDPSLMGNGGKGGGPSCVQADFLGFI